MAERFLRDGLKSDPKNREVQYYLADTYEKSGSSDKALKLFRSILEDHEDEILAEYRIGLLLMKHNQFEKAINSFKSVINKDVKHIDALFNMAIAYEGTGNVTQAKGIYNTLTKINPNNPDVPFRLGSLYLHEHDNARAKECFLKLLNSEKYLIEAHLGLSKVYLSMNDPESCIRSCDELLKHLNLSRNITVNSIRELSDLYIKIGIALLRDQKESLVKFSFKIAELLNPGILEKIENKTA
jgi:tetratricopeptide (TPR) repeat protein